MPSGAVGATRPFMLVRSAACRRRPQRLLAYLQSRGQPLILKQSSVPLAYWCSHERGWCALCRQACQPCCKRPQLLVCRKAMPNSLAVPINAICVAPPELAYVPACVGATTFLVVYY